MYLEKHNDIERKQSGVCLGFGVQLGLQKSMKELCGVMEMSLTWVIMAVQVPHFLKFIDL